MINIEQIKALMAQHRTPVSSTTEESPPVFHNKKELWVYKNNRQSLRNLAKRLADNRYYSSITVTSRSNLTGEELCRMKIMGNFDYSKIICGDCSTITRHETYEEKTTYPVMMITPNGAVMPSSLICSNCGTNFINLLKQ